MKTKSLLLLIFFLFFSLPAFSQEKKIPIIIDGDEVNYSKDSEKIIATGNVVMKKEKTTIKCEKAEYDILGNKAYIYGDVEIIGSGGEHITAVDAVYDFTTETADMNNVRYEAPPMYGESLEGEKMSDGNILLSRGFLTTCDKKKPHYNLTSKRITIYPGERMVAKNMFLRVANVPIFYIPYYSHSLKDKSFVADLSGGKDKEWGIYAITSWRYKLNQLNQGKIHLDHYEERGNGYGVTHRIEKSKFGEGLVNLYYIDDSLYQARHRPSFLKLYGERAGISDKYIESNRYKAQVSYEFEPTPKLSAKLEFHKFSDPNFMKDFFYPEYSVEPANKSYLFFDYRFHNSSFSFLTQKRVNHFFSEVEYLPKLEYNFYKQPIGETPLYLESNFLSSNTTSKTANSDVDNDAVRFHSENSLSLPKKIAWLSIDPFVTYRGTYFSKNSFGDENIIRNSFSSGITLHTKLFKYFQSGFDFLGEKITSSRHVLTPKIVHNYDHAPTVSSSVLAQFDDVDSLSKDHYLDFTLENKLQVKGEDRSWDMLYFAPTLRYQVDQENKGTYFNYLLTDFEFHPKKNLSLIAEHTYSIPIRRSSIFNINLRHAGAINERGYSIDLGHRYVRTSSSLGTFEVDVPLTPWLRFKNYLGFEYNTRDFKEQHYALKIDLHCWWLEIGLDVDKYKTGFDDYKAWFVFTLKAFPDKLNFGYDHTYKGIRDRF